MTTRYQTRQEKLVSVGVWPAKTNYTRHISEAVQA